ncbi:thioredoxin family protein [Oceanihabitans sp. 2_MG-2023]|uniref:thioredoxin family protein n=1 Tax=Oceanihabitans sp. 2_MG-2023 TaxID=3062661 RepID=UPI0026E4835E|nr:thioredoxin family protein [Oceanihabitans sp. 2_MG-2023]MDO6595584.1 thioredoxin family protein [Oceanihabitans sp. 2_MG-2023]
MKRTVFLLIAILSFSIAFSQTLNQEINYGENKKMLLGPINKQGLEKAPYNEWFTKSQDTYEVNEKITEKLKDSLKNYTIKVFLGTWCGDSKKEVPRFYSILEKVNFSENQLEVIALDRSDEAYKQGPNGEEKGMNIHRVPTFIFYKNGEEVNRIVEHPKETLERDMLKIVNGDRYSSNYIAANYVQNLLESKSIDSLKTEESNLVSMLSEYVKGSRELNTLGYVYLRAKEIDKAMYVFDLNTKIFPYKYNVYDSLAEAYFETKNHTEALKNYYKVLSLNPEDKNAPEMIEKIKPKMKK